MAGVVAITEERLGNVYKVVFDWTSSGGGAADATTTYPYTGTIERVVQIPSGVAAPSASWDCMVNDSDGADVLMGAGANLSEATITQSWWEAAMANTKLTLAITNAGSAKAGKTIIYIRK